MSSNCSKTALKSHSRCELLSTMYGPQLEIAGDGYEIYKRLITVSGECPFSVVMERMIHQTNPDALYYTFQLLFAFRCHCRVSR